MKNDIRFRRERAGLSQGELADELDVTRQTVNAIERDRYDPSLELAFNLAGFFDCRVDDIFDPDGD